MDNLDNPKPLPGTRGHLRSGHGGRPSPKKGGVSRHHDIPRREAGASRQRPAKVSGEGNRLELAQRIDSIPRARANARVRKSILQDIIRCQFPEGSSRGRGPDGSLPSGAQRPGAVRRRGGGPPPIPLPVLKGGRQVSVRKLFIILRGGILSIGIATSFSTRF